MHCVIGWRVSHVLFTLYSKMTYRKKIYVVCMLNTPIILEPRDTINSNGDGKRKRHLKISPHFICATSRLFLLIHLV